MRLDVLIEGARAGTTEILHSRHAEFTYAADYLTSADPTPLSVRFPLREEPYAGLDVAHWLLNLLPDDEDVLDRWCLRYRVARDRPLDLLGTALGAECAGAVQFSAPERTPDLIEAPGRLWEITEDGLWDGLRKLRRDWSYRFASDDGDAGRSLSGMQPKDALTWTGTGWAVPSGRRATTHILKLDRDRYPHEVLVEYVTLQAARRLGVAAAQSSVLHGDEFDVLVVERYDRRRAGGGTVERVHQEDFCQALGLAPAGRHQRFGGATVGDCAEVVATFGASSAENIARLRDNMLFRWIIGDTDGHAKNVGILLSGAARSVTPVYDAASFLPERGTTDEADLAIAMWGGEEWDDWRFNRTDTAAGLAALADALGLDGDDVAHRAGELATAAPEAMEGAINTLASEYQDKLARRGLLADVRSRALRCAQVAALAAQPPAQGTSPVPPPRSAGPPLG